MRSPSTALLQARSESNRWRAFLLLAGGMLLITLTAAIMFVVAICTAFQMRRLYAEVFGKWLGKVGLALCGVKMVVHQTHPLAKTQTIYLPNHTSTLDLFILLALGLPRTRFFLSGRYRKLLPLGIIGYMVRVFFTPPQSRPDKRVQCFQNAERVLRRTGDSVLLSPEGTRVTSGEIGPFNKGAFHIATNLKVPIVPIFIAIPRHIDPGVGFDVLPGVVHVYIHSPITTDNWDLDDLLTNKESVRDLFVDMNSRLRLE